MVDLYGDIPMVIYVYQTVVEGITGMNPDTWFIKKNSIKLKALEMDALWQNCRIPSL